MLNRLTIVGGLLVLCATARAEEFAKRQVVVLADGQRIAGEATWVSAEELVIVLSTGDRITLPANAVARVEFVTEDTDPAQPPTQPQPATDPSDWPADPNRTRYLYMPSAFPLGQGRGYLSQKELLFSTAAVGVTDFWDVQLGTVLPLLFSDIRMGIVGTKVAFRTSDRFGFGAGSQVFVMQDNAVGFAFANATFGTENAHATLAAGPVGVLEDGDFLATVVSVAANYRVGPKWGLLTENWILIGSEVAPGGGDVFVVPTGGVRLMGPSFSVDLALVPIFIREEFLPLVPIPFVDFTWNWGGRPSAAE